jgi:hypothetical protein
MKYIDSRGQMLASVLMGAARLNLTKDHKSRIIVDDEKFEMVNILIPHRFCRADSGIGFLPGDREAFLLSTAGFGLSDAIGAKSFNPQWSRQARYACAGQATP